MSADPPAHSPFRALLTETLPFEVPLIFSNEHFFNSAREDVSDPDLSIALKKLRSGKRRYTKPYQYDINKGVGQSRNLYLLHPLQQLDICRFYEQYQGTILYNCGKSQFSIRRPVRVSRPYVASVSVDAAAVYKDGVVEVEAGDGDGAPATIRSYYRYSGYEPLGAFRDSQEFIRLEKRFALLRQLDVAKCFANLYTHSIAWAVKDKELGKRSAGSHSFENEFDSLMQRSNYNETNGIPIGPEVSRLFAEIIFQDIDKKVMVRLKGDGLQEEWDFAIRRYIDDFHIFANTASLLDTIEKIICEELEKYKLYINGEKTRNEVRPFVSVITSTHLEIQGVFRGVGRFVRSVPSREVAEVTADCIDICNDIESIRVIIGRHRAPPSAMSGWILSAVLRTVRRLFAGRTAWVAKGLDESFDDLLSALLNLTFYICALDSRVRPSYRLGQVMNEVQKHLRELPEHSQDRLRHLIAEELFALTRREATIDKSLSRGSDNVELFNYLICGAFFIGQEFLQNHAVSEALTAISDPAHVSYFRYITAKACMMKATDDAFGERLQGLNDAVEARLLSAKNELHVDAETYLLLCDFLSAPDVDEARKRSLFNALFGGTITKAAMTNLAPRVGFVDWGGVNVEHLLKRKELRALYD